MSTLLIIADSERRLLHASLTAPVPAVAPGTQWREFSSATTLCGLEITAPTAGLATPGSPADVTCPECRVAVRSDQVVPATGRNAANRRTVEPRTLTFRKKR